MGFEGALRRIGESHISTPASRIADGFSKQHAVSAFDVPDQDIAPTTQQATHASPARPWSWAAPVVVVNGEVIGVDFRRAQSTLPMLLLKHGLDVPRPDSILRPQLLCVVLLAIGASPCRDLCVLTVAADVRRMEFVRPLAVAASNADDQADRLLFNDCLGLHGAYTTPHGRAVRVRHRQDR